MKDYVLRANEKYKAKAIRRYAIQFNRFTEPELVEHMDSIHNKSDYVRQLVLKDMKESN